MIISIHALREEGDVPNQATRRLDHKFQSTPSARRATLADKGRMLPDHISIHALREEGDSASPSTSARVSKFQSTPSARRATDCKALFGKYNKISIHALREEGDRRRTRLRTTFLNFNPRPPRGGRHAVLPLPTLDELFQSTPSARRATAYIILTCCSSSNFNPRPPRGGRRPDLSAGA